MSRASHRPGMPEEVAFPVTPMLDMAFQLMAFFVLTFQEPSRETRLDLYLPAEPAALPSGVREMSGPLRRADDEMENDLVIRAEADDAGRLKALRLGEAPLPGPEALADRLGQYAGLMEGRSLRVVLVADDALRYEAAAVIVGICSSAGVHSIRLAEPSGRPAPGASP